MRREAILHGGALLLRERDFLLEAEQVRPPFQELRGHRFLRAVERAFRAGHPMRALVEEVVGAVAVPQVVEAPGCARRGRPSPHRCLVNEHLHTPDIPAKVVGIGIGAGQPRS